MSSAAEASDGLFEFFRFKISIAAAIISIVVFHLCFSTHAVQLWRSRNWICICLVMGAIWEVQSYVVRIFCANEAPDYSLGLYIAQATGSLLAPALFAAAIYVCLGRVIASVDGEKYSLIRLSWLTKVFVVCDILGLCIQGAGAGFLPQGGLKNFQIGSNMIIGGLAVLFTSMALFVFTAALFHYRIARNPTALSAGSSKNWLKHLRVLYVTSALILVRSVFRLLEYSAGNDSIIMRSEWTLYVFDAILMAGVLVVFAIWQPIRKGAREDTEVTRMEFGLKAWRKRGRKGGESVGSEEAALK